MTNISIIHPSRGRAKLAKSVYDKWVGTATQPENIEYILSVDIDDPELGNYKSLFDCDCVKFINNDNKSAIEAINVGAEHATGNLLIVVSDDFDCQQGWDVTLFRYLKDKKDFIVKTYDGLQPWIITLPIMDRVYYNRFGYIYYPEYRHMFCDTEMTCVGDLLDKTIIAPITFQHKHYTQVGGIKKDDISVRNDSTWKQGEQLFLRRFNSSFFLQNATGVVRCDQKHVNWLRSKGINFEMV